MWGFIGIAVNLDVIHLCQRLYKDFSIPSVFRDIISKAVGDCFVLCLGFFACLLIERCCGEVFHTKQ